MTDFSSSIQDALFNDISAVSHKSNIIDWIAENRTIKGKPWQWIFKEISPYGQEIVKDFRYLIPIYLDPHDTIVVKKARQLAFSEYGINKEMYQTNRYAHTTAIHVFPLETQAKTFSNIRLTPLFNKENSPKLYRLLSDPELVYGSAMQAAANVKVKQFVNNSNLILSFIAGSNSKSTDALSITADFVFLDEAADLPAEKISDVIECMSASSYKYLTIVGTPDYAGTEFDRRYEESDQREWIVTCPSCGAKQQLEFDKSIVLTKTSPDPDIKQRSNKYYYACTECMVELNRTADYAEWIPQNPESDVHGYHPTQLMASWISADDILRKKRDNVKYPHKFSNFVLGETYSGGSKPITFQKLMNCKVEETGTNFKYISIGVDWGNQSHYMVLGANRMDEAYLLDYGVWTDIKVIEHAKRLIETFKLWSADITIMDSGYGKSQTQEVFTPLPGKAYSCFYNDKMPKPKFETIEEYKGIYLRRQDFQYHVTVNHTSFADNVLHAIDSKRFQIPMSDDDELVPGISSLRDMLDNIALSRVLEKEIAGKKTKKWIFTPAHFFATAAYALVGLDYLVGDDANDTSGNDEYYEPRGYR